MAVIPGTKYAEGTISGRSGNALSPTNVPSEANAMTQSIERFGAAIQNLGAKVKQKRVLAETSRSKALIDDAGWKARESLTGDADKDMEVWTNFENYAVQLANSSKDSDVNAQMNMYLNDVMPSWKHTYRVESLKIEGANAEFQINLDATKALEMGNVQGAIENYKKLMNLSSNKEDKAYYQYMIDNALFNSNIYVALRNIELGDTQKAQKEIDKINLDELSLEQLEKLNKVKNKLNATKTIKNVAYEAQLNKQADDMIKAYTNNQVYNGELYEELKPYDDMFNQRLTDNSLNSEMDETTYNYLNDMISNGYYVNDMDLFEAYASGLSTEQYKYLSSVNNENKDLPPIQKEQLSNYTKYISGKYDELKKTHPIPPTTMPEMSMAIEADKDIILKKVRDEIRQGTSPAEINKIIEANFVDTTDKMVKGFWGRLFSFGDSNEMRSEIYTIEDRQQQYDVLIQLYKSQDESDKRRLQGLLKRWYGD